MTLSQILPLLKNSNGLLAATRELWEPDEYIIVSIGLRVESRMITQVNIHQLVSKYAAENEIDFPAQYEVETSIDKLKITDEKIIHTRGWKPSLSDEWAEDYVTIELAPTINLENYRMVFINEDEELSTAVNINEVEEHQSEQELQDEQEDQHEEELGDDDTVGDDASGDGTGLNESLKEANEHESKKSKRKRR